MKLPFSLHQPVRQKWCLQELGSYLVAFIGTMLLAFGTLPPMGISFLLAGLLFAFLKLLLDSFFYQQYLATKGMTIFGFSFILNLLLLFGLGILFPPLQTQGFSQLFAALLLNIINFLFRLFVLKRGSLLQQVAGKKIFSYPATVTRSQKRGSMKQADARVIDPTTKENQ